MAPIVAPQPVFHLLPITWQAIQSFATVLAFVLGGWWTWSTFIRSRQRYPKVKLSYSFEQYPVDSAWRLVRVSLKIENQSNVLIKPRTVDTRLNQLKPWPNEIGGVLKGLTLNGLTQYKDVLDSKNMVRPGQPGFGWPVIAQRIVTLKKVEIEPNESETFHFDFIIDRRWEVVLIYSHIVNVRKRWKRIGWTLTSTFELTKEEGIDGQSKQ